jgi:hypothetical protein
MMGAVLFIALLEHQEDCEFRQLTKGSKSDTFLCQFSFGSMKKAIMRGHTDRVTGITRDKSRLIVSDNTFKVSRFVLHQPRQKEPRRWHPFWFCSWPREHVSPSEDGISSDQAGRERSASVPTFHSKVGTKHLTWTERIFSNHEDNCFTKITRARPLGVRSVNQIRSL